MSLVYLTTEDVADICRTTPRAVREWRSRGRGPTFFKPGGRVLYRAEEVERWVEASKRKPDQ